MMGLSVQHILLMLVVALLLFGRGKISELMGDLAKGIKTFKKGLVDEDSTTSRRSAAIEDHSVNTMKQLE
jgi:sec-independent protein translocase protein TatA